MPIGFLHQKCRKSYGWNTKRTIKSLKAKSLPKDANNVDDFIRKIRNEPQFSSIKNSEITLYGPSGTAISVGDPISSLIPGNSFTDPLRIQVPVGTDPTSATVLTKFWNSLRGMEPENGFLRFHIMPEFIPRLMDSLYIREAYEELFEIIWKNQQDKESKMRINRMAITGTPGIGKSVFLFYILWRLANIKSTKTVILHRQMNHRRIYVFQNGGCWIVSSGADIQMFLTDPDTWYLTDALLTPPDSVEAVTILVSSPAEKYYSDFLKYSSTSPLHYLPTWSLDELKRVAHVYSKSPEEVEKRFNMMGGVPRYVLEKDVNLEETINEKIGKLLLKNIMLLPTFEGATEKEISHRLVHFEVKPPCYTKYEPVIASQCVRRK